MGHGSPRFLGYRKSRVFTKQSGFNAPWFSVRGKWVHQVAQSVFQFWFLFETRFHYEAQAGLELMIILPQLSEF